MEGGQAHGCLLLFLWMEGGTIDQWCVHEAGWVTKYLQGWMEGRRLKYGEQVLGRWMDAWCIDNWVVWGMVVVNLGVWLVGELGSPCRQIVPVFT